jgi:uncharacterized protein (DUF1330 family)
MAAYLIVHRREITNPKQLKAYADGVQEIINKYGGTVVVRADSFKVLEGGWHSGQKANDRMPERITVIEFPDMARLNAWYNSPEYARLKLIRQTSAVSDVVAVEGI